MKLLCVTDGYMSLIHLSEKRDSVDNISGSLILAKELLLAGDVDNVRGYAHGMGVLYGILDTSPI